MGREVVVVVDHIVVVKVGINIIEQDITVGMVVPTHVEE